RLLRAHVSITLTSCVFHWPKTCFQTTRPMVIWKHSGDPEMSNPVDVLCAGIVVADHVCTPIAHVPAAGELVMADGMLLTIGGCAANTAVDLVKMGVSAAVVGRVGSDIFGRIVAELLRDQHVDVSCLQV